MRGRGNRTNFMTDIDKIEQQTAQCHPDVLAWDWTEAMVYAFCEGFEAGREGIQDRSIAFKESDTADDVKQIRDAICKPINPNESA
jgi:hypothetical protein